MAGYPVVDAGPATFRPSVTPTIGGVLTPVVAINSGASAGSKRINDSTPTAAETLIEQVHWAFDSADVVKTVRVGLNVQPIIVTALSSTAGEVVKSPEVACLKVTAMTSPDDVLAATRLAAGYPDVFFVYPGETLELTTDVAITDVYAIAALATGTVLTNCATVNCSGASHV